MIKIEEISNEKYNLLLEHGLDDYFHLYYYNDKSDLYTIILNADAQISTYKKMLMYPTGDTIIERGIKILFPNNETITIPNSHYVSITII